MGGVLGERKLGNGSSHTLSISMQSVGQSVAQMASPRVTHDFFSVRGFPSISLTEGQAPECTICSERYDDSEEDLIPRNLACGHSMCSSKWL